MPDRRGRGRSGPYGEFHGLSTEIEDLGALLDAFERLAPINDGDPRILLQVGRETGCQILPDALVHQFALRLLRKLVHLDHGAGQVIGRLGLGRDADIAQI